MLILNIHWNSYTYATENFLKPFISVINELDGQNFCFTISSFHASTCFEHMCSKHVSWLITEMHGQQNVKITKINSR